MSKNPNNNIAEKLRNHVNSRGGASLENSVWQLMLDAADEIERLQFEVKKEAPHDERTEAPWSFAKIQPNYPDDRHGYRVFSVDGLGEHYNQLIAAPVFNEANARLLSAAPALLEALERITNEAVMDGLSDKPGWESFIIDAKTAIEEARGEV